MDFAIIGGDDRFIYLARLLRQQGRSVHMFFRSDGQTPLTAADELSGARNVIMNYPPKLNAELLTYEEILSALPPSARIYLCGPKFPAVSSENREIVNLWADEELVLENAYLTAEGAISAAMQACSCALRDVKCMIIGWGRIGRALTEILVGMKVEVTVASRSESGRNRAIERGAEAVDTQNLSEYLPGKKIIFSTPPSMVLDEEAMRRVDRDALIIDLASPPYGVNLQAAWNRGIRAWREPGLPGRYCPESAGMALMRALLKAEERGESNV